MDITVAPTEIPSVLTIDTAFFRDDRGFFIENWHEQRFREHGIDIGFVQDNHSRSGYGVLRGLHYQDMTAPMAKLVRCTVGKVLDVAVDLRVGSPTFGKWVGVELSDENMRQVWVPAGFAHGFVTLSESAEIQYKCTGYYTPSSEGAVRWNDSDVAIDWPFPEPVLSAKDQSAPLLKDYLEKPAFYYSPDGGPGGTAVAEAQQKVVAP